MNFKSAPKFWEKNGLIPTLLSPASIFYARGTAKKLEGKGYRSKAKVICIGNIVAGGSGKTPVAMSVAQFLQKHGKNVHFISKGYGRKSENIGTVRVKGQKAEEVGDEPILLSQVAPTWVGESREELAKQAEAAGAEILIMDDGFQNSELEKDLSFLVIDGGYGLGNGKVIPAGPLREPAEEALKRAQAVIVVGKGAKQLPETTLPVFKCRFDLDIPENVKDEEVVAFCGIGRPEKFFQSLKDNNIKIVEELAFPDHHFYNDVDFKAIFGIANFKKAVIVTTAKDMVKVPDRFKKIIYPVTAHLEFEDEEKLTSLILDKLK